MNNLKHLEDLIKNYKQVQIQYKKQTCLVEEFTKSQLELPIERRTNICMISCPCSKCRIYSL